MVKTDYSKFSKKIQEIQTTSRKVGVKFENQMKTKYPK